MIYKALRRRREVALQELRLVLMVMVDVWEGSWQVWATMAEDC